MKNFTNRRIAKSLREITNNLKGSPSKRNPKDAFKRPVYVFSENELLLEEYESKRVCAEKLGFDESQLFRYIRSQKLINGMYFSYSKTIVINKIFN